MAKPRVHEIASELGIDSKVALAKLKELGEFVKSPSSTIEPPVARKLRAAFEGQGADAAKGSGTTVQDVNKLLKNFEESKKMMKKVQGMSKFASKGNFKLPFMHK